MSLLTGTRRALLGRRQRAWALQFYQENDGVTFGSGANIDDLLTGDCTIECWFNVPSYPAGATYLLTKNDGGGTAGWRLGIDATGSLFFAAFFAGNDIGLNSGAVKVEVNKWYHAAVDFDVGTLTARLFLSGALVATSIATLAYLVDAAQNLICNGVIAVGTVDDYLSIGPIRISNSRRYTGATASPPTMNNWPANDANAQLITRMDDAAGTTVTDYSGNGYNGTATFGANTRWYYGPV